MALVVLVVPERLLFGEGAVEHEQPWGGLGQERGSILGGRRNMRQYAFVAQDCRDTLGVWVQTCNDNCQRVIGHNFTVRPCLRGGVQIHVSTIGVPTPIL